MQKGDNARNTRVSKKEVVPMKKILMAIVALIALPATCQAQSAQSMFTPKQTQSGIYFGPEGGLNWLLNSGNSNMDTGFAVGGVIGYDFVGPRVEFEGLYRSNTGRVTNFANGSSSEVDQLSTIVNVLYDFIPGAVISPYVGAGAGMAFADTGISGCSLCSTQFAYQGIVGVGWNIDQNLRFNLDARYYGTSNGGELQYQNDNFTAMLGLTYKFGVPR
jgi:OmpA-OmpF porin, OOP family